MGSLVGGLREIQFKRWLDRNAIKVLSELGIGRGHVILDFGCGSGTYTIPAAKLVREEGKVYALDIDKRALDRMERKARDEGLENIVRIEISRDESIPLQDETVDFMLLIDVLHEIDDKEALFEEARRVLKPNGTLIVYPMHLPKEEVKRLMVTKGFSLKSERFKGRILLLKKTV